MTSLKSQRRLAAELLKVGRGRVWIDPKRIEDVETAITREEVRRLIDEGIIKPLKDKGVSRARARLIHEKKRKGLRSGAGSRSGAAQAGISKKDAWMSKVRALRRRLRELKAKKIITETTYRKMYIMVKSGIFDSVSEMERYIKTHELWRKR
ncbi:MAG: 50S ribosomal protein L19e [Candidatus Bathyarchaeia archaeon]